jgi:hypothetical protein
VTPPPDGACETRPPPSQDTPAAELGRQAFSALIEASVTRAVTSTLAPVLEALQEIQANGKAANTHAHNAAQILAAHMSQDADTDLMVEKRLQRLEGTRTNGCTQ